MSKDEHPSFFILDRIAVGDSVKDSDCERHLGSCERCRRYLADLERAEPIPHWLRSAAIAQSGRTAKFWRSRRAIWLALPTLAAASVVIGLVTVDRTPRSVVPPGITEKGTPVITAFIKREERVFQWDGRTAVLANDHVRLQIMGAGYGYVSVAAVAADGTLASVLYAGALERKGATQLPLSWRVDDVGSREAMSVVLSRQPLDAIEHARFFENRKPSAELWSTHIVFPKSAH